MTTILKSESFRNSDNNCTITVEQYQEKYSVASFWRVLYQNDGYPYSFLYKDMLVNKPRKAVLVDKI